MDADVAAGHGEGIERAVAQGKEFKLLARILALGSEPVADPVEIAGDLWVIKPGRIAANLEHHRLADTAFHGGRKLRLRSLAQVRQAFGHRQRRGQ